MTPYCVVLTSFETAIIDIDTNFLESRGRSGQTYWILLYDNIQDLINESSKIQHLIVFLF